MLIGAVCVGFLIMLVSGCDGDEANPPATDPIPYTANPTPNLTPRVSDPDFSTWVAVGDWVRIRSGCGAAYAEPPMGFRRPRAPDACIPERSVARITEGPFGNGEDFPFYKLDAIGWVSETDFTGPVENVSFVSATHGWASAVIDADNDTVTYRLFETLDAGDNWRIVSDTSVRSGLWNAFEFLDDTHGWLYAGPYDDATVYSTSDAGRTWAPVWESTQPYGDEFQSYSFSSRDRGWRTTAYHLERSTDGGKSWWEIVHPCDAERRFSAEVSFYDEAAGWLLCQTEFAGNAFQLFRTEDRGDSWALVNVTNPVGAANDSGVGLSGAAFLNATTGWVTTSGDNGVGGLFVTHDGGVTWAELPFEEANPPALWHFDPPTFVDESHGWMIATRDTGKPGSLYRTVDGGLTWALLRPPGDPATAAGAASPSP